MSDSTSRRSAVRCSTRKFFRARAEIVGAHVIDRNRRVFRLQHRRSGFHGVGVDGLGRQGQLGPRQLRIVLARIEHLDPPHHRHLQGFARVVERQAGVLGLWGSPRPCGSARRCAFQTAWPDRSRSRRTHHSPRDGRKAVQIAQRRPVKGMAGFLHALTQFVPNHVVGELQVIKG